MSSRIVRAVCLFPWIGLAAARVSFNFTRFSLGELPTVLAKVPLLPQSLRDPDLVQALVVRATPFIPPRRMGPCLKRSLMLLDLWSRCGLDPKFHLGLNIQQTGDTRFCHAWVTSAGRPDLSSEAPALTEIFSQTARSPN